jgi:hypothetical protein
MLDPSIEGEPSLTISLLQFCPPFPAKDFNGTASLFVILRCITLREPFVSVLLSGPALRLPWFYVDFANATTLSLFKLLSSGTRRRSARETGCI